MAADFLGQSVFIVWLFYRRRHKRVVSTQGPGPYNHLYDVNSLIGGGFQRVRAAARGLFKRKPWSDSLPREEKIIDLPEEEKFCPHDGTRLKEIGEERTDKLKTVSPARH